ncbi:DnaJ domain-containing protein, partial [Phlyctochytrium arcticum]
EQDHYAVLGLSKVRWQASEDDIKRAYRRKVLKHHPDKNPDGSDSFFKCVQKAWEIMSNPTKRKQWDSVDPKFDDSLPSAKAKGDFFEIYTSVFEKEARFSKTQPMPLLGTAEQTRDQVEEFYNAWFNFDSWRTFENLDEEDTDNVESREERRWLDRKNKAERTKRKKADNSRVNKLVEQAFALDPRIKQFREDDKYAKDAKKREKEAIAKAAAEEAQRKAEAEAAAKEKSEAEEKARAQAEKKDREATKNAIRKEKKTVKRLFRDNNNFLSDDASASAVDHLLGKLDEIMDALDVPGLEAFRQKLEEAVRAHHDPIIILDEEHMAITESRDASAQESNKTTDPTLVANDKKTKTPWSPKETATLIKAVKMFPGGTIDRWTKIAEYVNEHGGDENESPEMKLARNRTAKESISHSKLVQTAQSADRQKMQMAVKKPAAKLELNDVPTERHTVTAPVTTTPTTPTTTTMMAPPNPAWSTDQQLALEMAMRKFPATQFRAAPNERWEKIAGEVEGKSKKEVKARVKELAEMVKSKKSTA